METTEMIDVKGALDQLVDAWNSDYTYRQTWVENIALQFQDVFNEYSATKGVNEISNLAAERFLELLCNVSENADEVKNESV